MTDHPQTAKRPPRLELSGQLGGAKPLEKFSERATERDIYVRTYVLMPDHIHLLVASPPDFDLAEWARI